MRSTRFATRSLAAALLVACGSPGQPAARPPEPAANQEAPTGAASVSRGQQLFTSRPCGACHTVQGIQGTSGSLGPNLSTVAAVAGRRKPGMTAEDYLRESITEPDAYVVQGFQRGDMPKLPLDDQRVDDLVAFLMTRQSF